MKYECHGKNWAYWGCSHVPKDFFERIWDIAWLIGLEIEGKSKDKIKVEQTKEKFGSTRVYYSYNPKLEMVNEGRCEASPVWIAFEEGLLDVSKEYIKNRHDALMNDAIKELDGYLKAIGNVLPKTYRVLYKVDKRKREVTLSYQIPRIVYDAEERQRRLNPDLAHYIYLFAPYECNCPDDYCPCKPYEGYRVSDLELDRSFPYRETSLYKEDLAYIEKLKKKGARNKRYQLLKGGFVV